VSAYVGLEYKGLEVGLVTGYTYGDILPMVRYKKDKLFIAPAIEKGGKKGLVIGIEF
jgi:hypothetical protein|tara:strand:+ start:351 stop:521 length:171 start_codon:yes stop_codon:yes gene_type:complete